jgi:hypothetical protein
VVVVVVVVVVVEALEMPAETFLNSLAVKRTLSMRLSS